MKVHLEILDIGQTQRLDLSVQALMRGARKAQELGVDALKLRIAVGPVSLDLLIMAEGTMALAGRPETQTPEHYLNAPAMPYRPSVACPHRTPSGMEIAGVNSHTHPDAAHQIGVQN